MVVIDTAIEDVVEEQSSSLGATALEAALEAWAACSPDGYIVGYDKVSSSLDMISSHVPSAADSPCANAVSADMFVPCDDEHGTSVFQKMLRPRDGQVHFLHFWRAFGEAARLLAALRLCGARGGGSVACDIGTGDAPEDGDKMKLQPSNGSSPSSSSSSTTASPPQTPMTSVASTPCERLVEEVEALRDAAIRAIDESADGSSFKDQRFTCAAFQQLIRNTAEMSFAPAFWTSMIQALPECDDLCCDDISSVLISWLREATGWQFVGSAGEQVEDAIALAPTVQKPISTGMEVYVHIYDVSHEENISKLNRWLAHQRNPFKFGGVFHAGVEVNGLEWSFGMSLTDSVPGISCTLPKQHPAHRYRQTVKLRNTKLTAEEVADLITQVIEDYPGDDYDLLRRNCCHFADDFVRRMGAGRLPGWVYRLARVGAMVDYTLQKVAKRSLISEETELF